MLNTEEIKYDAHGLIPAIIQDSVTQKVLMQGYMNKEALQKTLDGGRVTFYSRSKKRLWTKGEESGNFLSLVDIKADCDKDSLLVSASPKGPTCHTGSDTCWGEENKSGASFVFELQNLIIQRKAVPQQGSYTNALFEKGTAKIAQKVGEEAVEVVIEAMAQNDELLLNESADLLYHFMVLLADRNLGLEDVIAVLEQRHSK